MTVRTKFYVDPIKVNKATEAAFGRAHGSIARFHEAMMTEGSHSHVVTYRVTSGKAEPSVSWLIAMGKVLNIENPLTLLKG